MWDMGMIFYATVSHFQKLPRCPQEESLSHLHHQRHLLLQMKFSQFFSGQRLDCGQKKMRGFLSNDFVKEIYEEYIHLMESGPTTKLHTLQLWCISLDILGSLWTYWCQVAAIFGYEPHWIRYPLEHCRANAAKLITFHPHPTQQTV